MNVPVTCLVISFLLSCFYLLHLYNSYASSQKISARYPYPIYNPGPATPPPDDDIEDLIKVFASVAALPPVEKVNSSCVAPSLTSPAQLTCTDQGLTGIRLNKPRKVAIMYMLSFEIDTLEIVLKEQVDVVDKFFLVEANFTHKGRNKPMMWQSVKDTERFDFVPKTKVIYIPLDKVVDQTSENKNIWVFENNQQETALKRIKALLRSSTEFSGDDLLISADMDEMVSRDVLQSLKHCQLRHGVLSAALIMPMGNFDLAFRSDHPVPDKPHSIGRTKIVQLELLLSGQQDGRRGPPLDNYVTGGVHLTSNSFVVTTLLKQMTCTECSGKSSIDFLKGASVEALDNFQQETYNFKRHPQSEWRKRCDAVSSITDMKRYIPWFLDCNRQRYPYWFGKLDPRNKFLYEALTNYFHPGFGSI